MRKHEINKRKKASQKRKSFGKKEEKKVRRKIRGRFQLIFDEERASNKWKFNLDSSIIFNKINLIIKCLQKCKWNTNYLTKKEISIE